MTRSVAGKRAGTGDRRPRPSDVLLRIEGLEAGYGALRILRGVSIAVREGALAVIIGPNGSGKSTVIKSLFNLTTSFAGRISFDGRDITREPTHRIVRLGIAYVPQGRLVFDTLTVEDNLRMGAFGVAAERVEERLEEVLALFPPLRESLGKKASFLSGGQQQMLSIARALMRRPRLLLLDEPSLGLDPKTQRLIFRTIAAINATGTTILMVEQNAHEALRICTDAFVVENGVVAVKGGPGLARQRRIKELYLGGA